MTKKIRKFVCFHRGLIKETFKLSHINRNAKRVLHALAPHMLSVRAYPTLVHSSKQQKFVTTLI